MNRRRAAPRGARAAVFAGTLSVVLLVALLTAFAVGRTGSTSSAATVTVKSGLGTRTTAADGSVVTPPDLTGADTSHGTVTLAQLQASATSAVSVTVHGVSYGGWVRGYLVLAPVAAHGTLPIIVVLHGINASPTQEATRDELLPLVQQGKAILVYPAGLGQSWSIGVAGCCGIAGSNAIDDIGFVASVLQSVRSASASESGATSYLLGFSNGGKLAYQVQCARPTLFAALAVVSAVPLAECAAATAQPTSVWIGVGSADPELPTKETAVSGATALATALAAWRQRDECSMVARTSAAAAAPGSATVTTATGCVDNTTVTGVLYRAMAHGWPTDSAYGASSAAALIGRFFLG